MKQRGPIYCHHEVKMLFVKQTLRFMPRTRAHGEPLLRRFLHHAASTQASMSLAFQSVAPGHYLEFAPDCVLHADHGMHLKHKCREHGAKLVNGYRIVAFHQHVPTPLAHTHHEKFNLEIGRRLPLAEDLEDSLLGILVLYRRTLRAFEPADDVLHILLLFCKWSDRHSALLYSLATVVARAEKATVKE